MPYPLCQSAAAIKTTILCSPADERPSVKSISEPLSLFPVYFSIAGVLLSNLLSFLSAVPHKKQHPEEGNLFRSHAGAGASLGKEEEEDNRGGAVAAATD